ncbi:hypothetical protein MSAR_01660 [Mycolicibacterium sarraceniae]|uniref:Response regulatory domain-containing protein n=1 Tax=Mycolicibacterium sarraceniae TaxID=1534348 RepID=A0A7I7SKH8_9MYCO|nr:hypothetical protein MSAR_01660 [Mycolicibacterium sarraceniae]
MRAPHDPRRLNRVGFAGAGNRPISLLLIEDDQADAIPVEELIDDAGTGISVEWAASMAIAAEKLTHHRPDCVLLDLNLPHTNGISAVDRVTKLDATLPIVVFTGLNDEHFG